MRIAIDAREVAGRPTGVGRYLAELLARWTRDPEAARHSLLLVSPQPLDPAAPWRGAGGAAVRDVATGGTPGTWWEQTALPRAVRRTRADVLFAPAYTAPLASATPLVVALHDVSFAAHPEWFPWREGLRRRVIAAAAAWRARAVLTLTEFSRGEILRRFRLPPSRVRVVAPAVDSHPCFGETLAAPPPAARREPLVLYVGSIFNRRRVPDLVAAFARAAARDPRLRLELIGENRTHPVQDLASLAAAHGVSDRVTHRDWVPDDALRDAYARARAFVFLSEYEGFGLTPLEALRAGVPVVLLDTPVAREVYRDAALYVAPGDGVALASVLEQVLDDEPTRGRLLAAGARVLGQYSWDRTAAGVLRALEEPAR